MFRDKIELKDLEKMDAEYRELLGGLLPYRRIARSAALISMSKTSCRRRRLKWIN